MSNWILCKKLAEADPGEDASCNDLGDDADECDVLGPPGTTCSAPIDDVRLEI